MDLEKKLNKTLFLWLNNDEFHAIHARKRGIDTASVYKKLSALLKLLRRGLIRLDLFYPGLWLGNWKKELGNYDTVIIHASILTPPVVKYIRIKAPDIRIIVWYWNPIAKSVKLSKFSEEVCERWVFDEEDANRYSICHNTQYYFNDIKLNENKIEIDIYFVGGDKGRLDSLINLMNEFGKLGLKSYFHITKTNKGRNKNNYSYKNRLSYAENLNYISRSVAILDIVSEGQSGLTLRPLEALFFNKKLITNDKSIINKDFYSPENIFILGYDPIEHLRGFLIAPLAVIRDEVRNKYDFDFWFSRFFKK